MNKETLNKLKVDAEKAKADHARGYSLQTETLLELIALAEKQQIAEDAAKAIIAAIGDMPESDAPHAQAPAEQQESIDTPEFWRLYSEWREAVEATRSAAPRQRQAWIAHIDTHTAAAVANVREEMQARLDAAISGKVAQAALAQPVDLSKLERFSWGKGARALMKNHTGKYVRFTDVEQLISAFQQAEPVAYMFDIKGDGCRRQLAAIDYDPQRGETVIGKRPLVYADAAPAIQQPQDKPNADCSGDPTSCPDNEGYGCACDPMNKAASAKKGSAADESGLPG